MRVATIAGNFDLYTYKKLKKQYDIAVAAGQKQFTWEGKPMLVSFAEYLLEYLTPYFKGIQ